MTDNDETVARHGAGSAVEETSARIRETDDASALEDPDLSGPDLSGAESDDDDEDEEADLEDLDTDELLDDPDLPRGGIPGGEGQRSGSRLDPDGSYAAGSAARDALEEGRGLDDEENIDNPDAVTGRGGRTLNGL